MFDITQLTEPLPLCICCGDAYWGEWPLAYVSEFTCILEDEESLSEEVLDLFEGEEVELGLCRNCLVACLKELYTADPIYMRAYNATLTSDYFIDLVDKGFNQVNIELPAQLAIPEPPPAIVLPPSDIVTYLDKYVVGQDLAKEVLAIAVSNHSTIVNNNLQREKELAADMLTTKKHLKKSNVLVMGPSGCGKTYLIQKLGELLKVPVLIVDMTRYSPSGYVGQSLDTIFLDLKELCDNDEALMERSIIVLDEIDKISLTYTSTGKDNHFNPQRELLKMLEGGLYNYGDGKSGGTIDTSNILWVCLGAFNGLEDCVKARVNTASIGFGAPLKDTASSPVNYFEQVQPEDLIKYGLIPELVGRLAWITYLHPLTVDQLVNVLTAVEDNRLNQYKDMLAARNVEVTLTPDAIRHIAELSYKNKLGARGMDQVLLQVLFKEFLKLPASVEHVDLTKDDVVTRIGIQRSN